MPTTSTVFRRALPRALFVTTLAAVAVTPACLPGESPASAAADQAQDAPQVRRDSLARRDSPAPRHDTAARSTARAVSPAAPAVSARAGR
ncbi:MAG: hypothetical protein U9Q74_11760, partial [Gemmatimonadota bacterium]|nr:hypothetical protein [Gemmatimonadota bacterium]